MELYSAIKKKEILPFVTTWMNTEDIRLSQTEKQYHLCLESKKQSQTHRNRE